MRVPARCRLISRGGVGTPCTGGIAWRRAGDGRSREQQRVGLRGRIDIDRNLGDPLDVLDPKSWERSVTLPDLDKPSRPALREFERTSVTDAP